MVGFGVAVGGASQAADDVTQRLLTRVDAIERIDKLGTLSTEAQREMTRIAAEDDITRPEAVAKFRNWLQSRGLAALDGWKGTAEGRLALKERIADLSAQYQGEMVGRSLAAQEKRRDAFIGQVVGSVSARAYDDPAGYDRHLATFDVEMRELSGAMTPEEEQAARAMAVADIALTTVSGLADRGQLDDAEAFLMRTDVEQALPPAILRQMRTRISSQRAEQARAAMDLVEVADSRSPTGVRYVPRGMAAGMAAPGKAPLVQMGTQIGNIPPGYQVSRGPAGEYRMEPIPGGPVDRENQAAAAARQSGADNRARTGNAVEDAIYNVFDIFEGEGAGFGPGAGPKPARSAGCCPARRCDRPKPISTRSVPMSDSRRSTGCVPPRPRAGRSAT